MGGQEIDFVQEAFDTNWIAPLGANVNGFEQDLQSYTGRKHAAVVTSGTAAIHLGLILCDVQPGDEVICQSFTFAATANPIKYQGAEPIFIDSEPETWNMDPVLLEKALKERGDRVKAILVVHLYGMPAKMERIIAVASKYGMPVIEDSAEALGSSINEIKCGTFGKLSVLSFNGNKIITTSGGGALLSDDEELVRKSRFLATQARDDAPHYQHSELGYNYRMSNIVAGIGRGQMKVLDERIAKKKYIFEYYKRELENLEGVDFMPINAWNEPNYWLSVMTLDGSVKPLDIMEALEKENIESRPVWKPMHMQPFFAEYDYIGGDVSEKLFENGLCLPSDTKMTDEDLERICSIIKGLWSK